MTSGTRSRPNPDPDPESENKPTNKAHPDCDCQHHQPQLRVASKTSILEEIAPNRLHNPPAIITVESLAADLNNFHICSPAKENVSEVPQAKLTVPSHCTSILESGERSAPGDLDIYVDSTELPFFRPTLHSQK